MWVAKREHVKRMTAALLLDHRLGNGSFADTPTGANIEQNIGICPSIYTSVSASSALAARENSVVAAFRHSSTQTAQHPQIMVQGDRAYRPGPAALTCLAAPVKLIS
jgi:hypothetical protein